MKHRNPTRLGLCTIQPSYPVPIHFPLVPIGKKNPSRSLTIGSHVIPIANLRILVLTMTSRNMTGRMGRKLTICECVDSYTPFLTVYRKLFHPLNILGPIMRGPTSKAMTAYGMNNIYSE